MADPTSRRVSGLLRELGVLFNHSRHNDWIGRQLGIILDAIREEVEESDDIFSGPMAQSWIIEFSRLMEWTATGDYSKLPENLLEVAMRIDGVEPAPKQVPHYYTTPSYMGGRMLPGNDADAPH